MILALLGGLAVIGYAYFGDMGPDSQETVVKIPLPGSEGTGE
ncbi:hypothetical protein [Thioclava sp. SK-1]|nr:hypothetical protein [Thioclava sp. SK-1]